MSKKVTSIRIDEENKAKLIALAKREGLNISQLINKTIKNYSPSSNANIDTNVLKSFENKILNIEKEMALQRQRTNILKNQIDFIIKSKNARKEFDNRTQEYNKSAKPMERQDQQRLGTK